MTVRKGTYILEVCFRTDRMITVGALGPHLFRAGAYCYVGSAMGGLDQRLSRHLSRKKTLRWHIDYLTSVCDGAEAWESYPDFICECRLGHIVEECGGVPEMDGFGCSDCRCRSHLFRVDRETVANVVSRYGLEPFSGNPSDQNIN